FDRNTVVYTGTHDNDTTIGWWKTLATDFERSQAQAYLGPLDERGVHWAFMRAAQASVADLCVVPLQDALGLDSAARMNTPSRSQGNWTWRYQPGALNAQLAHALAALAEVTDRTPPPPTPDQRKGEPFSA